MASVSDTGMLRILSVAPMMIFLIIDYNVRLS